MFLFPTTRDRCRRTLCGLPLFPRDQIPRCVPVLIVLMALPMVGNAQERILTASFGKSQIQMTPPLTIVDATQNTATLVISNPTEDTVVLTLSVSARGVGRFGSKIGSPNGIKVGRLLELDAAANSGDSLVEDSALVGWIKALPRTLTLAPGEQSSLTVTVSIPADVKPGRYAAWILASMPARASPPVSNTGGKADALKITVREGAPRTGQSPKADSVPEMVRRGVKLEYRIATPR